MSSGERMQFYTTKDWLSEFLANKSGGIAEGTRLRYQQVFRDFLAYLGPGRSNASVGSVSPGDLIGFRDKLRQEGRSATTCNMVVKKVLSVPFVAARKLGFIPMNPVAAVDNLRDKGVKSGREAFSAAEIERLVSLTEGDWHGAIILGVNTGLRLGDVANLCWEAIDAERRVIRLTTGKTGANVNLPIHRDFDDWLQRRTTGIGKAPVFPELAGKRIGGDGGLSAQFRAIVDAAGIKGRVVTRTGKGRATNSKTFHALRHTFISRLANVGVAPDLRQKLAGHADPKVHANYTHHEEETMRAAIDKLPSVTLR
jgi:integrase